jgi:hypothetical protein
MQRAVGLIYAWDSSIHGKPGLKGFEQRDAAQKKKTVGKETSASRDRLSIDEQVLFDQRLIQTCE